MPAYLISICRGVSDRRRLEEYWANVTPTFAGYDIKPLAVYTPFKLVEGAGPVEGIAVIEFPSMDAVTSWYNSDAYQKVKPFRMGAAEVELIFADGGTVPVSGRMPQTMVPSGKPDNR